MHKAKDYQGKEVTKIPTIAKHDVTKRIAKLTGEKIYNTSKVTDALFKALRQFMMEADPEVRIEIRNFGVFEVKKTKTKARNPKTGETILIPARRKTHCKVEEK